jgi:cell wall-associated NlpC family hydrolase
MNDVVSYARECLNTPFRHQGRLCGYGEKFGDAYCGGLDCAGVIIHCAKRLGIEHADMQGYPRLPYRNSLQEFLNAQPNLIEVPVAEMAAGDVILMSIKAAPNHLGIYAGNGYMIHAYDDIGRTVEQRIDDAWLKKITAVYRFVK